MVLDFVTFYWGFQCWICFSYNSKSVIVKFGKFNGGRYFLNHHFLNNYREYRNKLSEINTALNQMQHIPFTLQNNGIINEDSQPQRGMAP